MRSGKKYIFIKFKFLILNQILVLSYQNWQNELACCMRQTRHPVRLVTALGVLILWSVVRNIFLLQSEYFQNFQLILFMAEGTWAWALIFRAQTFGTVSS